MTGTIPDPIRPRESRHRQCRSRPFSRDFFDTYPTSASEAVKSINGHIPRAKRTYGGSGQIYEIRAIHVDPHRRRQLQSRLLSTRLDGVIYVTEAAKVDLHDTLNGIIYVTDDVGSLPQWLRKSYKAIYGSMDTVQDSGAAIAIVAALNGKYNNPRMV